MSSDSRGIEALSLRVLLLEDDACDAELIAEHLASHAIAAELSHVRDRAAFESSLRGGGVELILSDYYLPGFDGGAALERARELAPDVPFIFVSGAIGEELAIESLQRGATDYVLKHRLERLGPAIRRAMREHRNAIARRAAEAERDALLEAEKQARRAAERAAADHRLLADASHVLAAPDDLEATLERLARALVPARADCIAIEIEAGTGARRWVSVHADTPHARGLAARWERERASSPSVLGRARGLAVARRSVELVVDVIGGDEGAWAFAPLFARDQCFGVLVLATGEASRLCPEELALAEELGRRIALAVDARELLEQAQRERRRAEDANRSKDEFLATVSHELRTPLNAITGWTRMLLEGALSPEKRERALRIIERNARAQTQLIDDLLDVSRIVSGKLAVSRAPLEMSVVAEMAIEAVRPQADAKDIELVVAIPSDSGIVVGDADRLQQVLWNLLTNALKFTPSGGRVELSVVATTGQVEIAVRDTGQGIAPEFLPHVFERFRQADGSLVRAHGGLGLGLTIVRHIVELHGGSVEARSEGAGRGSTFVVRLPASPGPGARPRVRAVTRTSLERTLRERPRLRGVRVVIVDDEADAREVLVEALQEHEAQVVLAASAAEALEIVRSACPDVLVSDIGMPGEDGYSLIRRVRALEAARASSSRMPAVALTAYSALEDQERALREGFDRHVSKPVEPSELAHVVAELARQARRAAQHDEPRSRAS